MASALELRKGIRVKIVTLRHENLSRAWPFQMECVAGSTGTVVTGPFKGDWYLLALDCSKEIVGTYRRFVSVTPDEIERA